MSSRAGPVDGCLADERLREALREAGADGSAITYEKIETPEQAEKTGFRGSPTILVDGRDPFADEDAPVGLSSRIYRTDAGPAGAPSLPQLVVALLRERQGAVACRSCDPRRHRPGHVLRPARRGRGRIALGIGAVLDAWALLAAAGAVAAGLLVRSPCGYRNGEDRMPSELETRRGV